MAVDMYIVGGEEGGRREGREGGKTMREGRKGGREGYEGGG